MLQADNVQPTHNKQDFERTSPFQKLELRLKDMTWEYWYSVYACVHGLQKYLLLLIYYHGFWISSALDTSRIWVLFLSLNLNIEYLQSLPLLHFVIFKALFSAWQSPLIKFCRDRFSHKIGYQKRKRRNPVGLPNPSMKKPLVTEKPVALDNCSSPVPISNAQDGSEQSNLREKLIIFTGS